MKQVSTIFLKLVIFLIGSGVLAGLIIFPQTEGRAANLDIVNIYTDPFIIYIYLGSTPFFIGLYQAFKFLNFIDANKVFSHEAVNTLKNIKFVSLTLIGFIALALFYIRFFVRDDPAGPIALGMLVSFAVAVIATAVGVLERLLKNNLTV